MAMIVGVTAVLVTEPPAKAYVDAPKYITDIVPIGNLEVNYTIEPAKAGPNEIHLYFFTADRPRRTSTTLNCPRRFPARASARFGSRCRGSSQPLHDSRGRLPQPGEWQVLSRSAPRGEFEARTQPSPSQSERAEMKRTALLVVFAIGLVLAPQAGAHAEITPKRVPAASTSTFALSVAGEESSPTVKVAVRFPRALSNVKPRPVRGWQINVGTRVITWTGGKIPQGENGEFEIAALFPDTPGQTATFPTVQTYGNGTVARWIGAPAFETPAPTIRLTASRAIQPPPQ